jgi:hypothetical protein
MLPCTCGLRSIEKQTTKKANTRSADILTRVLAFLTPDQQKALQHDPGRGLPKAKMFQIVIRGRMLLLFSERRFALQIFR